MLMSMYIIFSLSSLALNLGICEASKAQRRQYGLLFEPQKKGKQKMVNIFEDNSSSHTPRHQEPTEH